MALFGFKARDPNRDRQTDQSRLQLLAATMADLIGQIEREKTGLNARFSHAAADAAFSMEAFENDARKKLGSQVDDLTRSMARSRARLQALETQLVFIEHLQQELEAFVKKTTADGSP